MLRALHALVVGEVLVLVALQQLAREAFLRVLLYIPCYARALAGLVPLRDSVFWTGLAGPRLGVVVFCCAARHGLAVKIALTAVSIRESLAAGAFAHIAAR